MQQIVWSQHLADARHDLSKGVRVATAIEYGLIAAIIAVGIIWGLAEVKKSLNGIFTDVNHELSAPEPAKK